jgi:hypothetical protein
MAAGAIATLTIFVMIPLQQNPSALMVPQILFQCNHCKVALQVPLSFAGQSGPCPQCGKTLQTPWPQAQQTVAPVEDNSAPKRHANPAMTYAADAPSLMGKSFTVASQTPRSLNRGIMADQAVNHGHEVKKELRQERKMALWIILVILFLAAAIYLMNSYVIGK